MAHLSPSWPPLPMSSSSAVDETGEVIAVQRTLCKDEHDGQSDFPEGGFTAWSTALGAFLVQFCGFGYSDAYGVYQDFYTQTYLTNSTPSAIAWIGSVNGFLVLSVGVMSGRMLDRGAFYHVMIIGCLLQSFSLFMLSLTKPNGYYQIFLAQGIGSGFATGLTYVPSIAVVSHHFQKRRSFTMGLVVAGASLGSIFHPIMLNNLINGRLGFANGVRASAGLISCLLFIACLLMRTRLPPQPKAVSYTRVLRNSVVDPAYIYSTSHDLSKEFSFYSLSILHSGSFIGRFTAGVISAYAGIPNTVIGSSLMSSAIIFAMIGLRSVASVVLIGISYGYFSGVCIGMMAPLVSYLTPDISDLGARMGITFAISSIGSLVGAPICGALLSSNYIWWKPVVFAGSVATCGGVIFASMQFILKLRQKTAIVYSKDASA
ncbi:MFS general substrate transporter [Rhizopogon salebrosus TDB-379]|nr:MFS general substrate transporter [Rhizopogon salebrosus TDB-379]